VNSHFDSKINQFHAMRVNVYYNGNIG